MARPTTLHPERRTYTPEEVAKLLGVGLFSVREAGRRGEWNAIRIGRRIVFPRHIIDGLTTSSNATINRAPAPTD